MNRKLIIPIITLLITGCSIEKTCVIKNTPIDDKEYIMLSNYCSSEYENSKFVIKNDIAYCSTNSGDYPLPRMKIGFTKTCSIKY